MTEKLFTPIELGDIALANRIAMAPLTRNRADDVTGEVNDLHVEYYAQRASAGLIVTEATQINPVGKGYIQTPGIHTEAQAAAWKKVTDEVHARGGKIVVQLWHVGRISHTDLQPGGGSPAAPSAINAGVQTFTHDGFVDTSTPHAMTEDEIRDTIEDYRKAAAFAIKAGFDGVEVHGANGYLIDQFLKTGANQRTDDWGGSLENRARFLFEVLDVVTKEIGAGRTGLRLSPFSPANGITDEDPQADFEYVVERLNGYGLSYLHVIEGATGGPRDLSEGESLDALRKIYSGPWMGNNGYDRDMAIDAAESGKVDVVAFGRPFISNPDLVERLKRNAPLNEADQSTFYGGGAEGFTDYPKLAEAAE
ncbi:N-ethylmaleimide reductase [Poseidonocella pacifica]|uniref:N-ethylmaleimide reductase n=1 Tax=Poseidonocella pacifica TaxID=871651 RepID=A0A1I0VRC0_9RHOB|nr:alkene reductase [Poseidonocella pacifica]SFA78226.1 N-ethylmaleimide reductase [Poseidonocella pacifica]